MTDNEIIKALECCRDCSCKECPCYNKETDGCKEIDEQDILDLINRQKAEQEAMHKDLIAAEEYAWSLREELKTAKAEAIKEFAERLKKDVFNTEYHVDRYYRRTIDTLVKEMVGEGDV